MHLAKQEVLVKETHRGLYYEDGTLKQVLEAGRYELPIGGSKIPLWQFWKPRPVSEVVLVDMRARELTIKGQEILTADKVAVRVNILVQFRVTDPRAAIQAVENYEDRLYSDVQLAARRALAAMTLEAILTSRHQLSEGILQDVTESAAGYGVSIGRADVKDLIFPGNLQEIMNRVITAERLSQAQLVEARTRTEVQRLDAEAQAGIRIVQAQAEAEAQTLRAEAQAQATLRSTEAEVRALEQRALTAEAYANHPALLRLEELTTLRALAGNANARLYLDFNGRSEDA